MVSPLDAPGLHVWRVSNYTELSGRGGLIAQGRWHTRGHAVFYCCDTVGHALDELEKQLTVTRYLFPDTYKVLHIRIPTTAKTITLRREDLPSDWWVDYAITQPIGDQWFKSMSSPVLCIPSGIGPGMNYVINTAHREADRIEVVEIFDLADFIYR